MGAAKELALMQDEMGIRDWYTGEYPGDGLGLEIDADVTFLDVARRPRMVYELLGVGDSLVRERVFGQLAWMLGVDYGDIYNAWLEG